MTLEELRVGDVAVVVGIDTKPDTKRRLLDIGLTRGAEIRVKRFAPLGDPVEIALKDFSLALRKSDASKISVRKREKGGLETGSGAGQANGGKCARGGEPETETARRSASCRTEARREEESAGRRGVNEKTERADKKTVKESARAKVARGTCGAKRKTLRETLREAGLGRRK